MSANFKSLLTLTAVGAFFVSATAMADYRDYNYKGWNSIYLREHAAATARVNRTAATVIARSEGAPVQVAQAPSKERANSYEPATDTAKAAAKVASRSFSYEPVANAPVLRRGGRASGSNSYESAMHAKGY
jgi:hypothetical protein